MPEGRIARVSLADRAAEFAGRAVGSFVGGIRTGQYGVAARQAPIQEDGRGFSPGQPLQASLPEGFDPRSYEVRAGRNLSYTPRGEDGRLTPFSALRSLADSHSVTRAVIQDIKHILVGSAWDVSARDSDQETARESESAVLRNFLKRPDRKAMWGAWLSKVIEDCLVVDAVTLMPQMDRSGRPYALKVIDGATIKPLVDILGDSPDPPAPAYQQILYGRPETEFAFDELMYRPKNMRTWTPYGQSPTEMIAITINLALRRELHYLNFYTTGNLPDALYQTPEKWSDKQIKEYEGWFNDLMAGDSEKRAGRIKFVPGGPGAAYIATKNEEWKYEFDEYLARIVAWAFGRSPLPIAKQMNRASAEQMERNAEASGIGPIRMYVKSLIDEYLQTYCGAEWAEFTWVEERPENQALLLAEDDQLARIGARTLDEIRTRRGDAPLPDGLGARPFVMTAQGPVLLETALAEPVSSEAAVTAQADGAVAADLARWRKCALKDVRAGRPVREFRTTVVPDSVQAGLRKALGAARTEADVAKAFRRGGPAVRRARIERDIYRAVMGALAHVAPRYTADALERLKRGDPLAAIAKQDEGWDELAVTLSELLSEASGAGAEAAIKALGLDFESAPQAALDYAHERAAELVGRRWVAGELVENPNPRYAISETIREDVNRLTVKAIDEGWGSQELRDQMRSIFGKSRAETIARTETAIAYNKGAAAGYKSEGIAKVTVLDGSGCLPDGHDDGAGGPDESVVGVQEDAEADGQTWTVEEYAGLPTGHPRCVRSAAPIVETEPGEEEETE